MLSTVVLPPFPALVGSRPQHPSQLFALLTDILPGIKRHLIGISVCVSLMSNNLSIFFMCSLAFYAAFTDISVYSLPFSWVIFLFFCKIFLFTVNSSLKDWHFFSHVICPSQSLDALWSSFYFYTLPFCVLAQAGQESPKPWTQSEHFHRLTSQKAHGTALA